MAMAGKWAAAFIVTGAGMTAIAPAGAASYGLEVQDGSVANPGTNEVYDSYDSGLLQSAAPVT